MAVSSKALEWVIEEHLELILDRAKANMDQLQSRLTRSQSACCCTRCSPHDVALPSASSAGESDCRALTMRGVLVSLDRDAPAVALGAAVRRWPPPALLGGDDCRALTALGELV